MGAQQGGVVSAVGDAEVRRVESSASHQLLAQAAVLFHREAMARRQRQDEVVGVEKLHPRFHQRARARQRS